MKVQILLFDGFETLDICGPIEILARVPGYELSYYSQNGGIVESAQNMRIETQAFSKIESGGVIVLPGGRGTRTLVKEESFLHDIARLCMQAEFCLSICTGSGLFAKAGVLDGKRATSNKKAFAWAESTSEQVEWISSARWVVDGKFYTSSGVSAGMDMALGFVRDQFGMELAAEIAENIEYIWNQDCEKDFFAAEA